MNKLRIVLATDENYTVPTAVVIKSAVDNNHGKLFLEFHIFCHTLITWDKKLLEFLEKQADCNSRIIFEDFNQIESYCIDFGIPLYKNNYGAWCKLFMAKYLGGADPILWLDSDMVVLDTLDDLLLYADKACYFGFDMQNNSKNRQDINNPNGIYGIQASMLINPEIWNKSCIEERCRAYINHIDSNGMAEVLSYIINEQGVLGAVVKSNEFGILPARFIVTPGNYYLGKHGLYFMYKLRKNDYYSWKELIEAKTNPAIIHYMHFVVSKPWKYDPLNDFDKYWLKYYNEFDNEIRKRFPVKNFKMNKSERIRRWLFIFAKPLYLLLGRLYNNKISHIRQKLVNKYVDYAKQVD